MYYILCKFSLASHFYNLSLTHTVISNCHIVLIKHLNYTNYYNIALI